MRNIFYIITLLLCFDLAWSQDQYNLDELTNPDTLQELSKIDSFLLSQNQKGNEDSLDIDLVLLKKNINEYIDDKNQRSKSEWYDFFYIKENNHYATLKKPLLLIRKEGFTQYPHLTESMHILQSEAPFYDLTSKSQYFNLSSEKYAEPAMMSYAEAGLGDWKNSRGIFKLQKGNTPISDSLSFSAAISGINGYWFGDYETSSNINLNLLYRHKYGNFRLIHTTISENLPYGLSSLEGEGTYKTTSSEEILKFEHQLFETGLSWRSTESAGLKRKLISLLIRKQEVKNNFSYDLSAEYITESADTSWIAVNAQIDGNISNLAYNTALNFTSSNCYFFDSELYLDLYGNFGILAEANAWENDSDLLYSKLGDLTRAGAGIAYRDSMHAYDLIFGYQTENEQDEWYLKSYIDSEFRWQDLSFILRNWSFYYILPDLQVQTEAEIRYHLPYNNKIRLKYRNRFHTEYLNDSDEYVPDEVWHDIMLAVQISRNFEIRAEFTNITNNFFYLGEQQSGFTMLYNLTWYFVN